MPVVLLFKFEELCLCYIAKLVVKRFVMVNKDCFVSFKVKLFIAPKF